MKRRLLSVLLCMAMVASLTACGGEKNNTSSASTGEGTEKTEGGSAEASGKENSGYFYDGEGYKAVLVYVVGTDAPDQDRISEAFNELTKKELNMEVELMPMTLGTWISQVPMMLAGNEQIDLMPMWSSSAATYIASDYIEDLTPYLESEEGQYFKEQLGDEALDCCKIGDFTYGIPVQKERATVNAFVCRKDILDETGIDPSTIKDYEDMTAVYAKVKELHPDMVCLGGSGTATPAGQDCSFDGLAGFLAGLMDYGQTTTVTSWTESERFDRLTRLAREWYLDGYISKDMATTTDSGELAMSGGNTFSYMTNAKPNTKQEKEDQTGYELTILEMNDYMIGTGSYNAISYAVGSGSEDPEKAFMLLKWLWQSEEAEDLLNWGQEGTDWELQDDGTINYPEGVTADTCGYHQNVGWILPNQFNSHVWAGTPSNVWDLYEEETQAAVKSKAFGFTADISSVQTEYDQCNAVRTQYLAMVTSGSVDPDEGIAEFNQALKDAGIDDVIACVQEQLDAWLAEK